MNKNILFISILLGLSACVNNTVIPAASGAATSSTTSSTTPAVSAPSSGSSVKIYKFKKSISCDQNSGTSLADMHAELTKANISVKSTQCGSDGIARPAVCGTETGYVNVYEVSEVDATKARGMGFMSLSRLNGYSQVGCGR